MYPAPTRAHHRDFCVTEGWVQRTTVRGKTVDQARYELSLPDGRVLTTRISHPVSGREAYGKRLWAKILRDDLEVTEGEFWACVRDRLLPTRGTPAVSAQETIPLGLFHQLITTVGLPEEQVRAMTKAQAAQALADFYTYDQPARHDLTDVSNAGEVLALLDETD